MKIFVLFLQLVLISSSVLAQEFFKASASSLSSTEKESVNKHLEKYLVASFDTKAMSSTLNQIHGISQMKLEISDSLVWDIGIEQNEIRGVNFKAYTVFEDGVRKESYRSECNTYKGNVDGDPNQYVRLFINSDMIKGIIVDKDKSAFIIEPLSTFTSVKSEGRYIVYNLRDSKMGNSFCGLTELKTKTENIPKSGSSARLNVPTTCRIMEIATEADGEYFNNHGSNTNTVLNDMLATVNVVDGVYNNTFNVRIVVVQQFVFTNPATDPYNSFQVLGNGVIDEIRNFWNNNRGAVTRDAALVFIGKNLVQGGAELFGSVPPNGIGAMCTNLSESYAFTTDRPFNFYTVTHELGHLFNASHPDPNGSDCQPNRSVMCSGNNLANVFFANVSQNQVNSHLNSHDGCLRDFSSISVTGPDFFCSSATYTANVPTNQNVTWTSSPGINLSTTTGASTIANYNASGPGWVEATINAGCAVTVRRYLHAGPPEPSQMTLDGNNIYPNSLTNVCLYNSFNLYTGISGGGSTNWQITNNSSGAYIVNSSTNSAQVNPGSNSGNFTVKLTLSNSCGTVERFYPFSANPCGYFTYTVSPNPAKDHLNVVFENSPQEKNFPESFELFLETTYGTVTPVRKLEIRDEASKQQLRASKQFTFDVRDLARGRYILRVTKEKETETSKKVQTMHIVLN